MTKTPITDKAERECGSIDEVFDRMRSLETAAQGLRDALGAFIKHVSNDHPDDFDRDRCPHCLAFKGAAEALARFDALKEGK